MSNSQQPHGLQPTRLLRPWDLPGKSTGVGHVSLRGKYFQKSKKETKKTELSVLQVRREEMGLSSIREKGLEGTAHSDVCFVWPANAGDIRALGSIPGLGRCPGAWQPTPLLLPGEPHEQRSLAGYSPGGCRVRPD